MDWHAEIDLSMKNRSITTKVYVLVLGLSRTSHEADIEEGGEIVAVAELEVHVVVIQERQREVPKIGEAEAEAVVVGGEVVILPQEWINDERRRIQQRRHRGRS